MPSTDGYSITVSYTYSSVHPEEIEEIEKKLPKGIIIAETGEVEGYAFEEKI